MAHTKIYKHIDITNDRSFISQESTTGLWTGDTGSLTSFYTSDTQIAKANSKYFIDIYNTEPDLTSSAEIQYSLAYGHRFGSGSPTLTQQDTSTLSTKSVFLQLKNLLLESTDTKFTFDGTAPHTASGDHFYAIIVSRARYKGYVDPGNWQLTLSGSNGAFKFIDDSSQTLGTKRSFAKNGLVFNVASGSLSGTQGSTVVSTTTTVAPNSGYGFGLFYPQKGIIILNADVIESHVGFTPRTGTVGEIEEADVTSGENTSSAAIFISKSAAPSSIPRAPLTAALAGAAGVYQDQYNWHGLYRSMVLGADFQARSAEIVSSNHYFLRLSNKEFNYSNNPSFANATGELVNEDFRNDPKVFVTTVGLYNNANELLAVAKLSRPLEKSFSKEALLRVRLDF
jgi:hypothetical protein